MKITNSQFRVKQFSDKGFRVIKLTAFRKNEILFTYLPKMNFVEYLCSVGGLISMCFGFSVYDLVLIFMIESKKKILQMLVLMNC
jgi:hypothetical protein